MITPEEQKVWAAAQMALETTDHIPKNIYTAKEALVRTREALQVVVNYFKKRDIK